MNHCDLEFNQSLSLPNRWEFWEERGVSLINQGLYRDARSHYTSLLHRCLPHEHLAAAAALVRLAGVHMETENWDAAARYLRAGIERAQKHFGDKSVETHIVLKRYAYCLQKLALLIDRTLTLPPSSDADVITNS